MPWIPGDQSGTHSLRLPNETQFLRLRHGTRCRCLWGNDSKFGQSQPEMKGSLCFGRVVSILDIKDRSEGAR